MCSISRQPNCSYITFTLDSDLNEASPQFTLTCISTGGPATTVTWTRGSGPASGDVMTVFNGDTTAPQYTHTLTVTRRLGGLYRCTVANSRPSNASSQLNVQGIFTSLWYFDMIHSFSPFSSLPSLWCDCVSEWSGQCTSLLDISIRRTYFDWLHHLLPAARWRTHWFRDGWSYCHYCHHHWTNDRGYLLHYHGGHLQYTTQ